MNLSETICWSFGDSSFPGRVSLGIFQASICSLKVGLPVCFYFLPSFLKPLREIVNSSPCPLSAPHTILYAPFPEFPPNSTQPYEGYNVNALNCWLLKIFLKILSKIILNQNIIYSYKKHQKTQVQRDLQRVVHPHKDTL